MAYHLPPVLFLVATAVFVFRDVLFLGYRFIGNSDRWDLFLPLAQLHADNLREGRFSAWSAHLLGGFDTLTQPFGFPSPEFLLPVLLGTEDVPAVFSFVGFAMVATALVCAYWAIHASCPDRIAAVAGACIYGFATYGLLKLAQYEPFSVLAGPPLFHLTRAVRRETFVRNSLLLGLILTAEMWWAFPQEIAYQALFLFTYAGYRLLRGQRLPIAVLGLGFVGGTVAGLPRVLAELQTYIGSSRSQVPVIAEAVDWRTALRYLDRDIFGRGAREMLEANPFFPFEGNLLFASILASLLLIAAFVWWLRTIRFRGLRSQPDLSLMFGYVAFVFLAMHNGLVYRLVKAVFLNQGLLHTRIGFSAMLPIALISAEVLRRGRDGPLRRREWYGVGLIICAVAFLTLFDFEAVREPFLGALGRRTAKFQGCEFCLFGIQEGPLAIDSGRFLVSEVMRFGALAGLFVAVLLLPRVIRGFGRSAAATALALGIVFQAVWGGWVFLAGPQTRDYSVPFEAQDLILAPSTQFQPPTRDQRDRLAEVLQNQAFRSVAVCPETLTKAACSNTLGLVWNARMADGYLTTGVPLRLASLGWPEDVLQVHALRFEAVDSLPWRILSFLNVRQAVVMNRALYVNDAPRIPEDVDLVPNPSAYVYPRAYFAQRTQAVDQETAMRTVRAALAECAGCPGRSLDAPLPVDYVEGPVESTFDDSGPLTWESEGGDSIAFAFSPSARARFLIVNESYAPGWTARIEGEEAPVYPTNVVMRGVLVPPGASRVDLIYRSFLQAQWTLVVVVGTMLAALVAFAWTLTHRGNERTRNAREWP